MKKNKRNLNEQPERFKNENLTKYERLLNTNEKLRHEQSQVTITNYNALKAMNTYSMNLNQMNDIQFSDATTQSKMISSILGVRYF